LFNLFYICSKTYTILVTIYILYWYIYSRKKKHINLSVGTLLYYIVLLFFKTNINENEIVCNKELLFHFHFERVELL
jgi:hypothetical protein